MNAMKNKLRGCFLGKNIGGTLGMPLEGRPEFFDLTYYTPVPEKSVPNDDLDLQLIWLVYMEKYGLALTNQHLGEAWSKHIDAHPDEYGVALWNLRRDIKPPLSGVHNNAFTRGMGAAIRSEVWASLFPGYPRTAMYFAYQDASVDHDGEGILAEMFLAGLQSLLYVSENLQNAIDSAINMLPATSELHRALGQVCRWHASGLTYADARDNVMRHFGSPNFTDCIMNLCFVMLGLCYGEGDFEKSILLAVNCGQDTDCTGATVGGCLGIFNGAEKIPARWSKPLGDEIHVGDYIKGVQLPGSVSSLCEMILRLQASFCGKELPVVDAPVILPEVADTPDRYPCLVNGRKMETDGLWIRLSRSLPLSTEMTAVEMKVRFREAGPVQIMACGKAIFQLYLDGKSLGVWAGQTDVVPSVHRVLGGRVYNTTVAAGQCVSIRLDVYPSIPVADICVAFFDERNRFLDGVEYLTH